MSVINLDSIRHAKKQSKLLKLLDCKASHTALEVCLSTLNMNNLEELNEVKQCIKRTIKKLEKIDQDAKEENI
jgi:hypothetical protein